MNLTCVLITEEISLENNIGCRFSVMEENFTFPFLVRVTNGCGAEFMRLLNFNENLRDYYTHRHPHEVTRPMSYQRVFFFDF